MILDYLLKLENMKLSLSLLNVYLIALVTFPTERHFIFLLPTVAQF